MENLFKSERIVSGYGSGMSREAQSSMAKPLYPRVESITGSVWSVAGAATDVPKKSILRVAAMLA